MDHHAYYIEDSLSRFEEYKHTLKPFWAAKYERFGIDEARELVALAALKNFGQATFFVGFSSISTEAQQALLKLLEEPQEGTTFVLLMPHGSLLPTVRSRMMRWEKREAVQKNSLASPATELQADSQDEETRGLFFGLAAAFLKAANKERSDTIAKMLKEEEGLKERVLDFVNALETELAGRTGEAKVREALEDIAMVRGYLRDRSPSLKMLLEHLALALPQ